ncbi:transcriptional regulator [Bartonella tribocorum]|uniref:Transcriptional regulator n=1 Tax=Bartonella tribocorum TaxID=85701 RepID=A0A2M6UQT0_9HYPH|nr:transcriptional regulator [Bartonella tribocorum]PIT68527.1 transcriptional regulator [Bartonella tribocorum]
MVTSFGKILRKFRIDHSERLLDISVRFLSSVEIGKKSVPVGMEGKIIELYALDKATASLLRKEAYFCRKSFMIKASDPFCREIIDTLVRNLENFPQQDLTKFKKLFEKLDEKNFLYR